MATSTSHRMTCIALVPPDDEVPGLAASSTSPPPPPPSSAAACTQVLLLRRYPCEQLWQCASWHQQRTQCNASKPHTSHQPSAWRFTSTRPPSHAAFERPRSGTPPCGPHTSHRPLAINPSSVISRMGRVHGGLRFTARTSPLHAPAVRPLCTPPSAPTLQLQFVLGIYRLPCEDGDRAVPAESPCLQRASPLCGLPSPVAGPSLAFPACRSRLPSAGPPVIIVHDECG